MTNAQRAMRIVNEYAMKFGHGSPHSSDLMWLRDSFERAMNDAEQRGKDTQIAYLLAKERIADGITTSL